MTEKELRAKIVEKAKSYNGAKKNSAKHKEIISYWNQMKGIEGKASTSTAWCAIFVSVIFDMCGMSKLVPPSWNCATMRENAKKLGEWVENDAYTPQPGDCIIYCWDDAANKYATTDNKGSADHIGIVISCTDKTFTGQEGNKGTTGECAQRRMSYNGRYIRGFIKPNYASLATKEEKTDEKPTVLPGTQYARYFDRTAAGTYTVTASDGLNIRKGSSTKYDVIATMPKGAKCQCYGYYSLNGAIRWLYVVYGKYIGFACRSYLKKV